MPAFRNEVLSLESSDRAVHAIQNIIREVSISEKAKKSSQYLQEIRLRNYVFGMQYDVHECLIQILEKIYPSFNYCIFTVSCLESVQCIGTQDGTIAGCRHVPSRIVNNVDLTFEMNTSLTQDISSLITQSQRSRAPEGYRCDSCGQVNTCDKVDLITGLADVLIITLKVFAYDPLRNIMSKIVSTVNIN